MKYNFVFDTDFLAKNVFNLSSEEVDVVLATIVGKHNAIFYGNKPERLVDAVRFLSHSERFVEQKLFSGIDDGLQRAKKGIMYLKDFDVWSIVEQQFLYGHTLNEPSRLTQFIATTSINPTEVVVPDVLNNFDIIYRCKEGENHICSRENVSTRLEGIIKYHNSLHSGKYVTSTELEVDTYWLFNDSYLYLKKLAKSNPVTARKVAMVSRSISDCNFDSLTGKSAIQCAEKLTGARHEI